MKHYQSELTLSAPVATVYKAITTPQGLQDWWTTTCEIGAEVGTHATFRFNEVRKVMQIE